MTTTTTVTTPLLVLEPDAASWYATVPLLLCIPGSVVGGALCEWVGLRRLQLLLAPPLALSIAAMPLISWFPFNLNPIAFLITTRIIQGTIVALLNSVISVYPCEVSDAKYRGTLASLVDAWASLGFLLCYAVGSYLYWTTAAWVLTVATIIPSFIGLLASQESPPWLIRKGRREAAKAALLRLRGLAEAAEQELTETNKYCDNIKRSDDSWWKVVPLLRKRGYLLPMVTAVFMLMLKEVSGLSVISIYIVRIFQLARVDFDPFLCSVVVGSARLGGNFLGSALLHHLPRKVLLVGGNVLTAVATASMGVFFFLHSREYEVQQVDWIPLTALTLFMVGMAVGVGPATWLVAVEILPGPVRSLGIGVTLTGYAVTSFLVSKTFDDMQSLLGLHGLFWCYAVGCITYGVFVIVVVPETSGRSLKDIEVYWGVATLDSANHKPQEHQTLN
ncbi:hypothetical protein Pcinc_008624 [Petrolisthes cinctipes]|uniref:Major facilitator superfamily (MFS) profile domain-containing protein n=1 Tax=Petrolisthes cinctipes TaxID=88211 RepID=A0AAE1G8K5_PETCI|nr:hypothetical protein Pcinc_008624 [Petrolisthes cinctipes]